MGHYLCTSQWPKSPSSGHIHPRDLIPLSSFPSSPPQPPRRHTPLLLPFLMVAAHNPQTPPSSLWTHPSPSPQHSSPSRQQSRSVEGRRRQNQVLNGMLAHLPGGCGVVVSKPQEQPQRRCSEEHAAAETQEQPYTSCLRRGRRFAISGRSDA